MGGSDVSDISDIIVTAPFLPAILQASAAQPVNADGIPATPENQA
jgi:hypothetical protein